jgi:hypothetical protein
MDDDMATSRSADSATYTTNQNGGIQERNGNVRLDHWQNGLELRSAQIADAYRVSLVDAGDGAPGVLASQHRAVGIPTNVTKGRQKHLPEG